MLDSQGQLVTQQDGEPNEGRFPTSGWPLDQVVRDVHRLDLPAELAPGEYRVLIGLDAWPSLERLGVSEAGEPVGDTLELASLTLAR